jgi:DNA-binding GntR family transcriptional regulator
MTLSATKADEIALALEDAILSGELAPGVVLRQEQLSAEFGVSRTPIREALRKLAALELVSFAGRRGVQVRPLARDELLEMFTVRAALEGFAASLARDRLTKKNLAEMRQSEKHFASLTRALQAAEGNEREIRILASEWVQANQDFHNVYLQAASVPKLADAARSATRVFHGQALWSGNPEIRELYSLNVEQHRQIVEAFEKQHADVRELVERHILDSGRLLERAMEQAGYDRTSLLRRRVSWNAGPG